jgi:mannose-1-phosphate guanylyltransferase
LGDSIGEGAFECKRFVEKPDLETAEEYLASKQFAWNSGMFVFHAGTFLEAMQRMHPESAAKLVEIGEAWGTDNQQEVIERIYPTFPKISVDYGMMEPASTDRAISICTVPMDVTWLDVGSWPSYGDTLDADADGNKCNGVHVHLDSKDTLCVSDDPDHTITTIGCNDLVIVHTKNATLVCPRSEAQRVKDLHAKIDPSLQ